MTIRQLILPIATAILSGMAVASCQSDETDPTPPAGTDGSGNVTLTLSAAPAPSSSRSEHFTGDDLSEEPAADNELINTWIAAFVQGGKVVTIAEGYPVSDESSTGVWNDRVKLELPKGTYTVLAFANVDNAKVRTWLEGQTTLSSDWKNNIFSEDWKSYYRSNLVPMSGYLENVVVKGTVNEEFAVEVVRMLAKVEYVVKNLSNQKVTLNSFTIKPIYTGPIYLFPEYDKKPVPDTNPPTNPLTDKPRLPEEDAKDPNNYEAYKDEPRGFELSKDAVKSDKFYIKESIAEGNHKTNHFHIALNMTRGSNTEDVSYALADDELEFFYRNDYVLFPIVISDYVPELEVYDFPPIGGYPVQVTSEGNEFYATFSSSGAFDVLARLRDSSGATLPLPFYDEKANPAQTEYVRLVSVDPADISLTPDESIGGWKGNFDYKEGENTRIELTFEFKINNLIYTRKLYLLS